MQVKIKPHHEFAAVYQVTLENGAQRLATRNMTPGRNVYDEKLVTYKGVEYRLWDPFRSKLAAAILRKLKNIPINPGHKTLYLGAASGTTASHISDIVGEKGHVYCIEFASRPMRELVNNVCTFRLNMSPILEDARFPEKYVKFIDGKVNGVYCDIAQPEQAKVLADNTDLFLKKSGWIMLAVKAQSIDVTKKPLEIYEQEIQVLENRGFRVDETIHLEPYDKAHAMIVAKIE